jgi:diadenosine tetraphosphate (Ap4A) HIT family hydrolase
MIPDPLTGEFKLDPRLAADTHFVADLALCRVLLMDDTRFPWLILVPRREGLCEIADLSSGDRTVLWDEVQRAADMLMREFSPTKINIGALGNIVRQLHIHVVARTEGDDAWPGPVWGAGTAKPYGMAALEAMKTRMAARL